MSGAKDRVTAIIRQMEAEHAYGYMNELMGIFDVIAELEAREKETAEEAWQASYRCIDMDGTQELSFDDWWAKREGGK